MIEELNNAQVKFYEGMSITLDLDKYPLIHYQAVSLCRYTTTGVLLLTSRLRPPQR